MRRSASGSSARCGRARSSSSACIADFPISVFCQAVQRLHLATRCFAVDTWIGDEHAGFYGDEVYDEVCAHNRRYDAFSRLIRSDFSDACGEFADGSIDLLHVDGCHTYEAVRHDFESWLPKLSSHGVMLFHDTAEYSNGFGVHRLWEELRGRYPHFEFRHGHGLGIIGVGDRTSRAGARTVRCLHKCALHAGDPHRL